MLRRLAEVEYGSPPRRTTRGARRTMKLSTAAPTLASILAAALAACASTPSGSPERAAAQFERLKSLAGEWVVVNDSGDVPAGTEVRYRVTGGGSALVETIMPGTEHEMVSVYHTEKGRLVMTHYCAAGNQPRMAARNGAGDERIVFEFTGGANVDEQRGLYMSRAEFDFVSPARVDASWTAVVDGKVDHVARFKLVRSWK